MIDEKFYFSYTVEKVEYRLKVEVGMVDQAEDQEVNDLRIDDDKPDQINQETLLPDNPMRASMPILPDDEISGELKIDDPLQSKNEKSENLSSIFITKNELSSLWSKIEELEDRVISEMNNVNLGLTLITKLEDARKRIMTGSDQFDEVSGILAEIEYRLLFAKKVKIVSKQVGVPLLIYEFVWMLLLVFLIFWFNFNENQINTSIANDIFNINLLVNSLVWGGFGGVVGALYALWKHIAADQDFDPQFSLWYITNPILGISLGGFVYLVIQAGFLSLTAGASGGEVIQSAAVIYVFAWICGFKQNVIYEIVRRILDVFRVNTEEKSQI